MRLNQPCGCSAVRVFSRAGVGCVLVLSCLVALSCLDFRFTLYTAVLSFEIMFPFGLWVFESGWLLDHSELVSGVRVESSVRAGVWLWRLPAVYRSIDKTGKRKKEAAHLVLCSSI